MKRVILSVMLIAMSTTVLAGNKPIDADCNKMATNARGFAELKQGGIATSYTDLQRFVVSPTVQTYPVQSIIQYVMDASDPSPDAVYTSLYNRCTLMGYKELLAYFLEREEIGKLRIQIALKEQEIATLRQQNTVLTQENTSLKYPVSIHRREVSVAPVVRPVVATPVASPPVASATPTAALPGCHLADGTVCGTKH